MAGFSLWRAFLCSVLFALGDEIQNGLKMEKPRAFDLSGGADADTAKVSLARALVKFGTRKSGEMFRAIFGTANPNRQAVGSLRE